VPVSGAVLVSTSVLVIVAVGSPCSDTVGSGVVMPVGVGATVGTGV